MTNVQITIKLCQSSSCDKCVKVYNIKNRIVSLILETMALLWRCQWNINNLSNNEWVTDVIMTY